MKFLLLALFVAAASAAPAATWGGRLPPALLATGWRPVLTEYDGKIVGGVEAGENEFPWIVSFQAQRGTGFAHFCGGSIADENNVITAAHCTAGQNANRLRVVAGKHRLSITEQTQQAVGISSIIQKENYNSGTFENDISILVLAAPLDFSKAEVAPVNLPNAGELTEAGTVLTVAGWGTTSEGGALADALRKVDVPAVLDATCNESYSGDGYTITPSMICAGSPNGLIDSCQGDSGGPLFRKDDRTLIGIVSWGIGCARPKYYGVYTEVSYFRDWIDQNLGK